MDDVTVRRATASDAQAICAVFDAAVRAGWTFLGELAQRQMFTARQWDELVENYAPPNALRVASDGSRGIVGFSAVDVAAGEMFLLRRPGPRRARHRSHAARRRS